MKNKKWFYTLAAVLVVLLLIALLAGDEAARAKLPSMIAGIAIAFAMVMGIILLAYFLSGRKRRQEENFKKAAVPVPGKVYKVERVRMVRAQSSVYSVGGDMHILRAEYDYEGKHHKNARRSYFGEPPYKVGDSITVFVDPKNPANSKILNDDHPVQEKL